MGKWATLKSATSTGRRPHRVPDLTRLDKAIADGDFFANPVLTAAVDKAVAAGKAVHIMGLLSPGGVHSHDEHIPP